MPKNGLCGAYELKITLSMVVHFRIMCWPRGMVSVSSRPANFQYGILSHTVAG